MAGCAKSSVLLAELLAENADDARCRPLRPRVVHALRVTLCRDDVASRSTRIPASVARCERGLHPLQHGPQFQFAMAGTPLQAPIFSSDDSRMAGVEMKLPLYTGGRISNGIATARQEATGASATEQAERASHWPTRNSSASARKTALHWPKRHITDVSASRSGAGPISHPHWCCPDRNCGLPRHTCRYGVADAQRAASFLSAQECAGAESAGRTIDTAAPDLRVRWLYLRRQHDSRPQGLQHGERRRPLESVRRWPGAQSKRVTARGQPGQCRAG